MPTRFSKYGIFIRPALLLAILSFNLPGFSQAQSSPDSVFVSSPYRYINLPPAFSFFLWDFAKRSPDTIIPSRISFEKRNSLFYDSLETRASKHLITKKLYDLFFVSGPVPVQKKSSASSQSDFSAYSGKVIRHISINRLNVFGTNINSPLTDDPSGLESFLNKTHLNTNEFIIKNNLLFSPGDTVSPLILSDNERLLRELPFIDESRIIVIPASDGIVDIMVLTKDVYSLGANFEFKSIKSGSLSVFDKNLLGIGHEFRLTVPYDPGLPDSPGFGFEYSINNIRRSFIGLDLFYFDGLGKKTYGFNLSRKLVSSTTKYAGGISIREMFTSEDLDTMAVPEPLKYNLQDYWLSRSFLLNRESVLRLILGARYTNNNVFDHPVILPDSYHYLQQYKMFLGSVSISMQKFYKTNLIYGYGRTEDIPYGGMITLTGGREINEFKNRHYAGIYAATAHSIRPIGYFYSSGGVSTFLNNGKTEQGLLQLSTTWFSNLMYLGSFRVRNFIKAGYTRGFDRNTDESLTYLKENGFEGFRNDSIAGTQRLSVNLESVFFSPGNPYGFRFAFFAFGNLAYLFGTNQFVAQGEVLSGVGVGVRIRNDNLVLNTLQIRLGFYPHLPEYSRANCLNVSGEQLLKPDGFNPGAPTILPYR
jgi:hypothetical protein